MTDPRAELTARIDADRDRIAGFLSDFVKARSPNPPGDTVAATRVITDFLAENGLPWRVEEPLAQAPNVVGAIEGAGPGRHLVLNGHIDVFPANEDGRGWTHGDAWSGAIDQGRVWGRGTADMKCGTTASIFTYLYLNQMRAHWNGRLTLTAVSDEETGGKWGARWLLEKLGNEVKGDCVLNGEPGHPSSLRFAEKGTLRLTFMVRTPGAHGAYVHLSPSASRIAGRLMDALDAVTELQPEMPPEIRAHLDRPDVRATIDKAMGAGTADVWERVTMNVGVLRGGLKVNMIPSEVRLEVDIRLPIGITQDVVMARIHEILKDFPEATVEIQEAASNPANYCAVDHEMVGIITRNAQAITGTAPVPIPSMGMSDCKHFRYHGVPAYIFGCDPGRMGSTDESISIDDLITVTKVHALSALDYLTAG